MNKMILFVALLTLSTSCVTHEQKSDAYGQFEADEIVVSAQGNGQLLEFNATQGDWLKMNQFIGLIDTTDLHLKKKLLAQQIKTTASQLDNISAEMAVQSQLLKNNKTNQKRIANMFEKGAATQKQKDDIDGLVELNIRQISAIQSREQNIFDQIKAIEVQMEQVDEAISKCMITNPVEGTALVVYAHQGEMATLGRPLYKLADLSKLKLKAYISGAQLSQVNLNQEVEIFYDKNSTENASLKGKVVWISPTAEFTPKTIQTKEERVNLVYAIKVEVNNDGTLKIGMPGEVDFIN
jgi:HlyD family secretion protein